MMDAIRKIYVEELKLPQFKDSDDFFDVGGHSLIMASIQRRLNDELKLDVAMDMLFRYPTLDALKSHIFATP
ncbi:acyl carrier protein [Burkholderia sp. Bp9140]|uniref:acyl carrier protein n=1 Tax=Burkholderia sp. Bp9140 TaxID=2184572 RepID=UPI00162A735F|nr:acyl carrier protein [Burkholderia sp. Bp9140]